MQEELQSTCLSPGKNKKLTIKTSSSTNGKKRKDKGASEDNQSQNLLTKDQTLELARIIWRYDLKLRDEVRQEIFKERRQFYNG